MRRVLRDLSSVLILSGLLLLVDGGVTLLWQEPVTAAIGMIRQDSLDKRYESYRTSPLSSAQTQALRTIGSTGQRIAFLAQADLTRIHAGDAIGRIDVPAMSHTAYTIVQGTDTSDLEDGPGHYPSTALPGMGRTVGIAGHRTTYLAPFRFLNKVTRGDRIIVTMPYGTFTYVAQSQRIVSPSQTSVVDDVGYDRLVLSACNPLYSAKQRIVVFARLSSVRPSAAVAATGTASAGS